MPIFHRACFWWIGAAFLLLGVLSACTPVARAGCPDSIKIGVSLTVDDSNAKSEMEAGVQRALAEINQQGIGDGCKLELVTPKNQKSQPNDVQKDVQDLVEQGALAIIASQTQDGAVRVAQIARYFNIPVIIPVNTADELAGPAENAWVSQINPKNSDYAAAAIAQLKASRPNSPVSLAIVFEHSDYGESAAVSFGEAALKSNVQIALYQRYSPFLADFKEVTEAIRVARPNGVVLISTQPKQALGLVQGIQSLLVASPTAVPSATGTPRPTATQTPTATPTLKTTQTGTPKASSNLTPTPLVLPTFQRSPTLRPAATLAPLALDALIGQGPAFTSREFIQGMGMKASVANLWILAPWAEDASWPGVPQCSSQAPQSAPPASDSALVVRNVQGHVSLKLVAAGLEKLTQKTDWTLQDKKMGSWQDVLRDPAGLAEFRRALAQEIRSLQGCEWGSATWPISLDAAGQNQIPPLLVKISGGKLLSVSPKK